ncbi:Uncharacterised protein [Vibrio cholerae]|nr:Uncharacterised protein [Vibrio cholerae]CSB26256.1 Uncharacterised protein [Vibrio cholerae]CSC30424.1 Uncharacterised protein [Vibrio cholerae]CSI77906.1 Uncharacterised protein [Vibrio cholerae]CSI94347.1 Uncharacterised protein [Vibrio cholerae]
MFFVQLKIRSVIYGEGVLDECTIHQKIATEIGTKQHIITKVEHQITFAI